MALDNKLIDQLLADYKKPEDIIGENGLLKQLTKAILERALAAEMTEHVGYEKHEPVLREIPEEAFHHVQPRCAGGREVHVETRMPRQPALYLGMFMGSVVIADQVQLEMSGHLVEQTQELEPFLVPVALLAEAMDFAGPLRL